METTHGIDVRLFKLDKITSGCKGQYAAPTKLKYKMLYERFKQLDNIRLAAIAMRAAGLVDQI
jgi:hypothetical protein